jgi:hypothetical protein
MNRSAFAPFVVFVLLSACSTAKAPPESNEAVSVKPRVSAGLLVGKWIRTLPNGNAYHLSLFESGVMAFQHVGPKLPISNAFGRWSLQGARLSLSVVGREPAESSEFPLPQETLVQALSSKEIRLGSDELWRAAEAPFGEEPGVRARRERAEQHWAQMIERADTK